MPEVERLRRSLTQEQGRLDALEVGGWVGRRCSWSGPCSCS